MTFNELMDLVDRDLKVFFDDDFIYGEQDGVIYTIIRKDVIEFCPED